MYIFKAKIFPAQIEGGEFLSNYINDLKDEYTLLRDKPIPDLSHEKFKEFYATGNRLGYERDYFARRARLRDSALAFALGIEEDSAPLRRIIEAICSEDTWALPAHTPGNLTAEERERVIDLFAAETAQSLTEIVALLGDSLDEDIRRLAISKAQSRVLSPFINRTKPYNWESMGNNWCAVCGGSVGMTAIYLTEDEKELDEILSPLTAVFKSYMESFTDDGACLEGLYYWGYGMIYLTAFLDLYRQRTGKEFDIDYGKFKKMASFPQNCFIQRGITVSFSDSSDRDRVYGGLTSYLSAYCGVDTVDNLYRAPFTGDDCGRWLRAARDIAWTNDTEESAHTTLKVLTKAQWAVMTEGDYGISFKGGHNGEPHNHNDIGSFTVVKGDEVMICDLGAGEYTKDYFSKERYTIFCNRSMGHSLPIIDDTEQKAGMEYAANEFKAENNTVSAHISAAYGMDNLISLNRGIKITDTGISLCDDYKLKTKMKITERFITRHSARIEGNRVIIEGNSVSLTLTANMGDVSIKEYIHREHDGSKTTVRAVDFTFTAEGEIKFSANFA